MNKKELIPQLTSLVEGYTDGLISANNKLFHSGQRLTAEKQEWEQKYHSAMAANKRLDEQNEGLMVEKQALLDVIFEWKNDNLSLTALNATLSEELEGLKKELANAKDARNIHYRAKLDQGKTIANLAAEVVELKKENHSINALNATLSEELQELKERCASQYQDFLKQEQSSQNWQGNYYAMQQSKDSLARKLDDAKGKYEEAYKVGNRWFGEFKKITIHCEKLKTELQELKKGEEALLRTIQNREGNYRSIKHELDQARKELAEDNAEKLRLHCLLQSRTEELAKKEKDWSKAIAAAEERHKELDKDLKLCVENCNYVIKENNYLRGEVEQLEKRHEEFKKRSDEILATMGENLQKKQETIEALTVWKTGTESVLDTMEAKLKDAKDVIQAQENTIEWLDGRVKRLKEKKAKKEQND